MNQCIFFWKNIIYIFPCHLPLKKAVLNTLIIKIKFIYFVILVLTVKNSVIVLVNSIFHDDYNKWNLSICHLYSNALYVFAYLGIMIYDDTAKIRK